MLTRAQALSLAADELGCLGTHVSNLDAICADGAFAEWSPAIEQLRSAVMRIASNVAAARETKVQVSRTKGFQPRKELAMDEAMRRLSGVTEKLSAGEAQREPRWSEIGIEQKVERLREALRRVEDQATFAARVGSEALAIAKLHDHGVNGQVMVPTDPPFGNRALEGQLGSARGWLLD